MSKYTTPSDRDYDDESWNRAEPCATKGCSGVCDIPSMSAFCYHCRCTELLKAADSHEAEAKTRGAA